MQIYGTASKKPSRTSSDGFFSSASSPNAEPFLHGGESLDANSWKSLRFFIVQLWGWAATVCCKRKVHLFISWAIVWFVLLLITQRVTPPPRRTEEPMGPEIRRNTGWNWSCLTRIVWCLSWISKIINSVCRNWSKISCSLVSKLSVNFIVHSTHVTDTNMEPNGLRKSIRWNHNKSAHNDSCSRVGQFRELTNKQEQLYGV